MSGTAATASHYKCFLKWSTHERNMAFPNIWAFNEFNNFPSLFRIEILLFSLQRNTNLMSSLPLFHCQNCSFIYTYNIYHFCFDDTYCHFVFIFIPFPTIIRLSAQCFRSLHLSDRLYVCRQNFKRSVISDLYTVQLFIFAKSFRWHQR